VLPPASNGAHLSTAIWDPNNPLPALAQETAGTGTTTGTYAWQPDGTLASEATAGSYILPGRTGLDDMRAREYSPYTSQFTTVDPRQEQTGQPYAYADDNPAAYTDLSGLCWSGFGLVCGAYASIVQSVQPLLPDYISACGSFLAPVPYIGIGAGPEACFTLTRTGHSTSAWGALSEYHLDWECHLSLDISRAMLPALISITISTARLSWPGVEKMDWVCSGYGGTRHRSAGVTLARTSA
jgi:RHS repeat-associated protein